MASHRNQTSGTSNIQKQSAQTRGINLNTAIFSVKIPLQLSFCQNKYRYLCLVYDLTNQSVDLQ